MDTDKLLAEIAANFDYFQRTLSDHLRAHAGQYVLLKSQHAYVLEREIIGFGLKDSFAYPVLVGMAILGWSDLRVAHDGIATLSVN